MVFQIGTTAQSIAVFCFESGCADRPAEDPNTVFYNVDLFGSLFFLISRYEEAISEKRDAHDRFASSASVLAKYNLLSRPIANEYIELLWSMMKSIWPKLSRKTREFRVLPSHDIDVPAANWRAPYGYVREALRALRRGKWSMGLAALSAKRTYSGLARRGDWAKDPLDTLDWIMEQSERHSLCSAFYYIPEKTSPKDRFKNKFRKFGDC